MRQYKSATNRALLLSIIAAVGVAIIFVVYNFDPAMHRWMPKCAFHELTGYNCPSCGNSRLLYHLLHGEIFSAWSYNYFMILVLPLIALIIYAYASPSARAIRLRAILFSPTLVLVYALAIITWWILRNILGI